MKTFGLEDAAAHLNVSPDTMRDLAANGDVAGAKIGKSWVFADEDLDEFLRNEIRKQTAERRNEPIKEAKTAESPVSRRVPRRKPKPPPSLGVSSW